MDLFAELKRAAGALDNARVAYALCGGLAVGAHGHVRATKDIDLLLLPGAVGAATSALATVGHIQIDGQAEGD